MVFVARMLQIMTEGKILIIDTSNLKQTTYQKIKIDLNLYKLGSKALSVTPRGHLLRQRFRFGQALSNIIT